MVSIVYSEGDTDQRKSRLPKKIHRTKELSKEEHNNGQIKNGPSNGNAISRSQSQTRSHSKIRDAIQGVFSHFRSKSRTSLDRSSTPGLDSPKGFKLFGRRSTKNEIENGGITSEKRQVHWQRSVHNIMCMDSDDSMIETPRNSISVLNLNHVTLERELNTTLNFYENNLEELDWKPASEIIPNSPLPSYIHASCARYGYTRARSPGISRAHLPPSRVELRKMKFENEILNSQNGSAMTTPNSVPSSEKPMSPETPIKDIINKFDNLKFTSTVAPKPPIPPKPKNDEMAKTASRKISNNGIFLSSKNLTNGTSLHIPNGIEKVKTPDSNGILSININGTSEKANKLQGSIEITEKSSNFHIPDEKYNFVLPEYPLPTVKTIDSFRELVSEVRSQLENLSKTAEKIMEDPNLTLHEEISSCIRSAHGMTNLLLRKNMSKFYKLCDDAMNPHAEKKTYPEDLEGFWMLIDMELENLRNEYGKIENWAKNGWKIDETAKYEKKLQENGANFVKKVVQNGNSEKSMGPVKQSDMAQKRRNDLAEFKRKAKEKMEADAMEKAQG